MVLGKLPVPGRPTIWITVGQGPTALAVGVGGGCLDIFTLIYPFFPLSPSLWETARYRLKYCLKGPLNPKPTNQPILNLKLLQSSYHKSCFIAFYILLYIYVPLPKLRGAGRGDIDLSLCISIGVAMKIIPIISIESIDGVLPNLLGYIVWASLRAD